MNPSLTRLAWALAAGLFTAAAGAQPPPDDEMPRVDTSTPARRAASGTDRLELGTTQITGNQELPKVMSIVPWKSARPIDMDQRPANSLLDEVLSPIDRTEFRRELRYRAVLDDGSGAQDE